MEFSLNEKPEDLFEESPSIEKAHVVNRKKAREIAEKIKKHISTVEAAGGNKYAAELDVRHATVDLLTKIKLSDYASSTESFSFVLQEESNAISMLELDRKEAALAERKKSAREQEQKNARTNVLNAWFVAGAVVIIFAIYLFY